MALTGAPCPIIIRDKAGRSIAADGYQPISLEAGDMVSLGFATRGARSYLAFRGGLDVAPVLGSASTDTLAVVGPEPVGVGAVLAIADGEHRLSPVSLTESPAFVCPAPGEIVTLDVVMGPRSDWFTERGIETLSSQVYEVTPQSNRVGIRLSGPEASSARTRRSFRARGRRRVPSRFRIAGSPCSSSPTIR